MADQLPFDTPEPATPATGADLAVPPRVWFLSADDLAATRDKLAQLTRRAARRGFTGGITLHAQPATRSHTGAGGIPVTLHGFDVTLTGTAPTTPAGGSWPPSTTSPGRPCSATRPGPTPPRSPTPTSTPAAATTATPAGTAPRRCSSSTTTPARSNRSGPAASPTSSV